jgi:hypothetical protein
MKQRKYVFLQNNSGFTLVELIVYFVIVGILMGVVVMSFTDTVFKNSQQSGIAETKIQTGIGLELLRADLEHSGFGLPWRFQTPPVYTEPAPFSGQPSNVPSAFSSTDASALSINASDYLVIRGTNVDRGTTGQEWGYVGRDVNRNVAVQSMGTDPFLRNDWVIVIRPESSANTFRELIMDGANFTAQITTPGNPAISLSDADFAPMQTPNDPDGEKYLVYGIDDNVTTGGAAIIRPFNRTDYFINNANRPARCAPGTGVLMKTTVSQANNGFSPPLPIIDCVADFQVVYYLDNNNDGGWDAPPVNANGLAGLTAAQIRDQVKAINCYILTHEGDMDRSYTYANAVINVGEIANDGVTLVAGQAFDLNATIGGNWANYRWKVYTIAVTPTNLQ